MTATLLLTNITSDEAFILHSKGLSGKMAGLGDEERGGKRG